VEKDLKPDILFEIIDYSNTPIVLSAPTWKAKAGNDGPGEHPEIRDYLEDVRTTVEKPHLVFQSTHDSRCRLFYRLSAGRGVFAGKHLVVVVKYVVERGGERGYISTVYLSRTVYARGEKLWSRREI